MELPRVTKNCFSSEMNFNKHEFTRQLQVDVNLRNFLILLGSRTFPNIPWKRFH